MRGNSRFTSGGNLLQRGFTQRSRLRWQSWKGTGKNDEEAREDAETAESRTKPRKATNGSRQDAKRTNKKLGFACDQTCAAKKEDTKDLAVTQDFS